MRSAVPRISLRLTLVSLLVGLLLATVAQISIGGIVAQMEARSFSIGALAIGLAVLLGSGALFWFLIKSMARIQMPGRPRA